MSSSVVLLGEFGRKWKLSGPAASQSRPHFFDILPSFTVIRIFCYLSLNTFEHLSRSALVFHLARLAPSRSERYASSAMSTSAVNRHIRLPIVLRGEVLLHEVEAQPGA